MAEYVEPPGFSRAEAFGPWLVGMAVDGALLGAVLSLTIEYFRFYQEDDGKRVKIMVAVAAAANVLKSVVLYANMWFKLVDGWGNFTVAFTYVPWFVSLDPLWSVLICMLAQSFFLMRLHSFLKGALIAIPIIVVIVLFMLLEFGGNIAMSVQIFSLKSQAEIDRFKKADIVNTVGQLSTDILIATCLCVALLKAKTGVAKTDGLVKKLIALSFTTAFIPATNNIVKTGLYHAYYFRSSSFIVFSIMQPKLYHLAMLVTLNIRQTLRRGSSHASGPSASYEMSRQGVASVSRGNRHPSRRVSENFKASHVGITVYKDTVTIQDDDTKPDSYEYSRSPAKIQPVV